LKDTEDTKDIICVSKGAGNSKRCGRSKAPRLSEDSVEIGLKSELQP